jgi:type I restriction enzyme R subunit
MQDHGLFQAVCRVNRVADESKKYGYIIDYKDLFKSLEKSISDYTSEAFDQYDSEDVKGLLVDRVEKSKERLETALETLRALCEPVFPKEEHQFIRFFCGNTENKNDLKTREPKRVELYKAVVALIRAYAEVANEMYKLGYSEKESLEIKNEVKYYSDLRDTIKIASGEQIDLKTYEPGMRMLMDMYIDAKSSKKISDFDNQSLVDLVVNVSEPKEEYQSKKHKEAVAETIENNVRKVIIEEQPTNPKYYEKMSQLLDDLIQQRKDEMLDYEAYLKKIKELAQQVSEPTGVKNYPNSLDSQAKRALYDNLEQNEVLALALDNVINANKLDAWRDGGIREKKLRLAVFGLLKDKEKTSEIMEIIKAQNEY